MKDQFRPNKSVVFLSSFLTGARFSPSITCTLFFTNDIKIHHPLGPFVSKILQFILSFYLLSSYQKIKLSMCKSVLCMRIFLFFWAMLYPEFSFCHWRTHFLYNPDFVVGRIHFPQKANLLSEKSVMKDERRRTNRYCVIQ